MALRRVKEGERKSVRQLAREKWTASGLSDRQARKLGLVALTGEQTQALGVNFHPVGSLRIPYFDFQGKQTSFFRIRYLESLPGFAGAVEKPQRYAQEVRTLNEVYLPPLLDVPWEQVADDLEASIVITEGELKAAAGCTAGLATIGLGGVDVWRSSKRGIDFLPGLARIGWEGREVVVIFDSDLTTKPEVIRAQRTLAGALLERGARVRLGTIPPGSNNAKQGLDDYLVAHGADKLKELIAKAIPYPEGNALWEMNEEVLFIHNPGVVLERSTGHWIDPQKFVHALYANRHYLETSIKKGQISMIKKPLAKHWLEWEHRAEVSQMVYAPGKPVEYEGKWNVWPGWGCEPKRGSIGPWTWLLDFLFKNDLKTREWFEKWCAYPIQHPGAKLFTASVLWSREQRVGKTLIAYTLAGIYGKNFIEIKNKDLKGSFNSWARNRQFVYEDEITGGDARVDADFLKGMITQKYVTIREKYLPDYVTEDCMNHYFSSNHPDAIFLEDRDGRFMIHEVLGKPAERSKYEQFGKWLANGGPAHLFRHLLDLNLKGFNPHEKAPLTPGKLSMINLSKNEAGVWVQLLQENPVAALSPLGQDVASGCDLFTPTHLVRAFNADNQRRSSPTAIGRALASAGFRQLNHGIPIMTDKGLCRIYAIRNQIRWEQSDLDEIREHFNRWWTVDADRKL